MLTVISLESDQDVGEVGGKVSHVREEVPGHHISLTHGPAIANDRLGAFRFEQI